MKFNQKLKLIRDLKKLTQLEIASLLKIHMRSVQRFESGEQEPRYEVLKRLCNLYPQYTLWLMTDITNVKSVISQSIEDKSL